MKAVSKNSKQLLLTTSLGICVIFCYAVIGFENFPEDFYMSDIVNGENTCSRMTQCFFHVMALGPRSTGCVGDVMVRISFSNDVHYFFRWLYDLSIYILINIIFLNVLFGQIIDTFAEMREKKKEVDMEMASVCKVCSLNRSIFDKVINGFENHVEIEHNIWHYLYFMYGLRFKDKTEYNGIESYISDKIKSDDIVWFPILVALSIVNDEQKQKDKDRLLLEKVDNIMEELKVMNQLLDKQK